MLHAFANISFYPVLSCCYRCWQSAGFAGAVFAPCAGNSWIASIRDIDNLQIVTRSSAISRGAGRPGRGGKGRACARRQADGNGDIATARLVYQNLALRGSANGARALAETYDPAYLKDVAIAGLRPDIEAAKKWHRRAADLGDSKAATRLTVLDQR